jgi:hypothetical protein
VEVGRPRNGHYAMVHRILPKVIGESWEKVRPTFQDGSAQDHIRAIWAEVQTGMPEEHRVAGDDISLTPISVGDRPAFLIAFPRPTGVTEAAFAIIPDQPAPTRYFVLELGREVISGKAYWVLCSWDGSRHLNMGPCGEEETEPEAARDPMIARVAEVLEGPGPA